VAGISHSNFFGLIRLIAAMLVIFAHSFELLGLEYPFKAMYTFAPGPIGVMIFFSLSGYLVAKSWASDPHIVRFFYRRALRIFPAMIACTIITIAVMGVFFSNLSLQAFIQHDVAHSFLLNCILYIKFYLPGVFENNPYPGAVNGSLWTLPIEFSCYVILGLTLFIVKRTPSILVLAIAFWAISLNQYYFEIYWNRWISESFVIYASDLRYVFKYGAYFFCGACIGFFKLERFLNWFVIAVAATLLIVFLQFVYAPFLLPIVVIGLGIRKVTKPFRWTMRTDYSYGIYIYAFPVQQALASIDPMMPWALAFSLTVIITTIFAALSWHLIEKPALSFKPRNPTTVI
jgi:peptidoglycan/LPS O-acetylase OafA/YrhL